MNNGPRLATVASFVFGILCLSPVGSMALSDSVGQKERVIALPELENPLQIVVEKGKAYFADERDILVYNLADGRFLKRFGKRGQGPGEFLMGPGSMTVVADQLVVGDFRKIKIFTLDGVYITQIQEPTSMRFDFLPVGRNYVGFPLVRNSDGTYSVPSGQIYDSNLKPRRTFFGAFPTMPAAPPPPGSSEPVGKTDLLLIKDYTDTTVYGDRVYVVDSRRGFSISVFDENGILLREIKHAVDKVKVPKSFIDDVVREWKASKYWKNIYSHVNPIVPEYFPDIINLKVDGGRIYALTSAKKNGLYEVIIMNLEGKILEKSFRLPLVLQDEFRSLWILRKRYDIEGDRFFWFAYNDDKDTYELHIR
ncbi:MAG: 6-bladed beta-propeller [Acidobacteriota bacterium]|nr:6-bladed beta-propeller [Acidobacteriota bacterium]